MTYVITQPCIGQKDASCYDVCPVDAIHPAPNEAGFDDHEQLYVDPAECIDCGACEAVCPHEAIFTKEEVPDEWTSFTALNAGFFTQ